MRTRFRPLARRLAVWTLPSNAFCPFWKAEEKNYWHPKRTEEIELKGAHHDCLSSFCEQCQIMRLHSQLNLRNYMRMTDPSSSLSKHVSYELQWRIQGTPPPTLFLDQTEARRVEKRFFGDRSPPPPFPTLLSLPIRASFCTFCVIYPLVSSFKRLFLCFTQFGGVSSVWILINFVTKFL